MPLGGFASNETHANIYPTHCPLPPQNRSLTEPRRTAGATLLSVLIALSALLSLSATASAQTANDYDSDNDGYIDVDSLVKFNAIRYDLNGDGARGTVSASDWANYTSAFPNAATSMGCHSTGRVGYELAASLDFDSDSDGDVGASDHSGAGWGFHCH